MFVYKDSYHGANSNLWDHVSDGMKPQDVGLSKDLQFFNPSGEIEGTPRVTSATIYKCNNFEVQIHHELLHYEDDGLAY